jgi:hypothetical protein
VTSSRKRVRGFPEPQPAQPLGPQDHRGHGHGWMMAVVCLPMIAIAVVLVTTGVANSGFLVIAVMCALMMAVMMRGMGPDSGRR